MMKWFANLIMNRRSRRLFERIRQHLPDHGLVADIGSGTGHNAQLLRNRTSLTVSEFDVEDLHWVGPSPQLFSATELSIPADDERFDAVLLFYVLQYPADPQKLLCEVCRVSRGPVLLLQSTCEGSLARWVLKVREFFYGRFGFYLARFAGLISPSACPMKPSRYYTRCELLNHVTKAGFSAVCIERERSALFVNVRRDLFVLQPKAAAATTGPEFAHTSSARRIDE